MARLWKVPTFWLMVFFYFYVLDAHLSYTEETIRAVVLKTLPILWLIMTVYQAKHDHSEFGSYKTFILLGLIFSIAGDGCLVWMVKMFEPGLLLFFIAHIFYTKAFGLKPLGLEAGALLGISAVVVFMFLLPGIKDTQMKIMTFSYSSAIFVMFWRSVVRWQQRPDVGNLSASLGALFFMTSDFIIALDKFRLDVPYANGIIMITYYLAQFFIASSVTLYGISGEVFLGGRPPERKEKRG